MILIRKTTDVNQALKCYVSETAIVHDGTQSGKANDYLNIFYHSVPMRSQSIHGGLEVLA